MTRHEWETNVAVINYDRFNDQWHITGYEPVTTNMGWTLTKRTQSQAARRQFAPVPWSQYLCRKVAQVHLIYTAAPATASRRGRSVP